MVQRSYLLRRRTDKTMRLTTRLDYHYRGVERHLRLRHVISRLWRGVETAIPDVSHDTDNLSHGRVFVFNRVDAGFDTFSDRVFVRKKLPRQCFSDDDDWRCAMAVAVVKIAAFDNRNAHCPEVTDTCGEEIA